MEFAKRVAPLKPSPTLKAAQKMLELRAKGIEIIHLAGGEPSFNTPRKIKEACKRAIDENWTYYAPPAGLLELRQAIAKKLKRDNQLDIPTDQIVVNCGAKQGIYSSLQIVIDEGDEVIIPSPYWVSYPMQVRMAQGIPVILETKIEQDFKINLEALEKAITQKTKMLILNSPSNPTGIVYKEEELKAIGKICEQKNIWVLSDEIYERLTYDGFKQASFLKACPELKEKTILVHGASKTFSMTGWRMGFTVGPKAFIEKLETLQGQEITSISTFVQRACITAFTECEQEIEEMRAALEKRRDILYEKLMTIPKVRCIKPKGAFYLFADMRDYKMPTQKLEEYLLAEAHILVLAGDSFGAPGFLRLSFVNEAEVLKEGIEKMKRALAKL